MIAVSSEMARKVEAWLGVRARVIGDRRAPRLVIEEPAVQ